MNTAALSAWIGQSTTGQGFAGIATIVAAVASRSMSWQDGLVALVPALILIAWPQKTALAAAAAPVVSDVEKAIEAYTLGRKHGLASIEAAVAPVAAPAMQDAVKMLLAAAASAPVTPAAVTAPVPAPAAA